MTVRNGTITLPPPATAAARRENPSPGRSLLHICRTHTADNDACPGPGCVGYCGYRPKAGCRASGTTDDALTPRGCVVCRELWEAE